MKYSGVLQKIGLFLAGVSIVCRVLSKVLYGDISLILRDMQLIGLLGVIVWAIGFFIQEGKKKLKSRIEKHSNNPEKRE